MLKCQWYTRIEQALSDANGRNLAVVSIIPDMGQFCLVWQDNIISMEQHMENIAKIMAKSEGWHCCGAGNINLSEEEKAESAEDEKEEVLSDKKTVALMAEVVADFLWENPDFWDGPTNSVWHAANRLRKIAKVLKK